jgi:hypothetical protein
MNLKQRFAILAVPAIVALGVGGALAVTAATPAPPAPANSQSEGAETETGGAAEKDDGPGGVQSGHNDTGDQADHQFDGEE